MADDKEPLTSSNERKGYTVLIGCVLLFLLGVVCVAVGVVAYLQPIKVKQTDGVGVVVDAGGSGTRLVVYQYDGKGDISQLKYIKCEKKGLANYKKQDFGTLKELLTGCFNQGSETLPGGKVVPIYFAATAGMRLLKLRNPTFYDELWTLIRKCIDNSKFKSMQAGTITGFEEAKWGWVAANYLKKALHGKDSFGTIDFGSSSLQLTFEQKNSSNKSDNIQTIDVDGTEKTIYGHSYLCYGMVEMERRSDAKVIKDAKYASVVETPCFSKGWNATVTPDYLWSQPCSSGNYAKTYLGEELSGPTNKSYTLKGTGDFDKCHDFLKNLLDRACTGTSCGMNSEFQPPLSKEQLNFLALSTFYYVGKSLKLDPHNKKSDFRTSAQDVCTKPYDSKTAGRFDYLRCLQASYGYYILNDGFKLPEEWNIQFIKKIEGRNVGWSLGLMYMKKDEMYKRVIERIEQLTTPGFIALIVVGVCVIGISIGLLFVYRRRAGHETIA